MPLSARAPARPVRVVFLDDGGVLNDNDRRAPEWRRLLGEFFAPRLGGTAAAWGDANTEVFEGIWRDWEALQRAGATAPFDWWAQQDPRWLGGMCERVGVPIPADVAGTVRASQRYVLGRIECAFTDAAPALRAMKARGLALHTASGGLSDDLDLYLRRMRVRELFDRLYGPDLIRTHKTGPRFYERIVEDSGVDPRDAVVVDDSPTVLEWAAGCGFRAVHMDRRAVGSRFERIGALDELLPLLEA